MSKLGIIQAFQKSAQMTKEYIDNNSGGGGGLPNLPPVLPPVAFTGSYNDLIDRPSIPDSFATVAGTGDYNDLINRPPEVGGELIEEYSDWIDISYLLKYNNADALGIVFDENGVIDKERTTGGSFGTYKSLVKIADKLNSWQMDEKYLYIIEGCTDFDFKVEINNFQLPLSWYGGTFYCGFLINYNSYGSQWTLGGSSNVGSVESGGYSFTSSVDTTTDTNHGLLNVTYELWKPTNKPNQSGEDKTLPKALFQLGSGNYGSVSGKDVDYSNVAYESSIKIYIRPRKKELRYPSNSLMGQCSNFIMDKLNTRIGNAHYQTRNGWIDITKDLDSYSEFNMGSEGQILSPKHNDYYYEIVSIPRSSILSIPTVADYITRYQQETGVTMSTNNVWMMVEFVDIPANTSYPEVDVAGQYIPNMTIRNIRKSTVSGVCYVSGFATTGIQIGGSTSRLLVQSNYMATNEMLPTSCVRVYLTFDNYNNKNYFYYPNVNEYEFTGDLQKVYTQAVKDAVRTIIDIVTGNEE